MNREYRANNPTRPDPTGRLRASVPLTLSDRAGRLVQASSDILLGWQGATAPDGTRTDYYVRQLRDWKYSAPIEEMDPATMATYGRLCGWTLARAHARSGDRIAIAAYLRCSDKFDQAVADFGATYADQTQRGHAALAEAVASGRAQARLDVNLRERTSSRRAAAWGRTSLRSVREATVRLGRRRARR